jgi:hypothetical protein
LNNKGSVFIYGMMVGLIIIILGMALAPAVSQFTNGARNTTTADSLGMNCSNSSISNFDKAACVSTDLTLFYFGAAIIFIGGAIIISRIIFE